MNNKSDRTPVNQRTLVKHFRDQILSGELPPGHRLPARSLCIKKLGASSATLQKAFTQLIRDGFVEARGKGGTFVTARPPHLYRYAVALPPSPNPRSNLYYATLASVAADLERELSISLPVFQSVDAASHGTSYRDLLEQAELHRLAGVIFVGKAEPEMVSTLLHDEHIRIAGIGGDANLPEMPVVDLWAEGLLLRRALQYLKKNGRRRVAVLSVAGEYPQYMTDAQALARSCGLSMQPYWTHVVHADSAAWATNLTHLMFRETPSARPDGLVVLDDHLVPHVCAGLVQAGVRMPEELGIVAHCNYPILVPGVLPMVRLGYDIRRVLLAAIGLIDAQKRGEDVPRQNTVEPLFEWQVEEPAASRQAASVAVKKQRRSRA